MARGVGPSLFLPFSSVLAGEQLEGLGDAGGGALTPGCCHPLGIDRELVGLENFEEELRG